RTRLPVGHRARAVGRGLSCDRGRGVRVLLPVHLRTAVPRRAGRDVLHPADLDVRLPVLSDVRLQSDHRLELLRSGAPRADRAGARGGWWRRTDPDDLELVSFLASPGYGAV